MRQRSTITQEVHNTNVILIEPEHSKSCRATGRANHRTLPIQSPHAGLVDHQPLPLRSLHERPELFDRLVITWCELEHRLYPVERHRPQISEHPFNELYDMSVMLDYQSGRDK